MENTRSAKIEPSAADYAIKKAFLYAKGDHFNDALELLDDHYPNLVKEGCVESQLRALRVYSYVYGHLGQIQPSLKSNQEGLNLIKIREIDLTLEDGTPLKFTFLNNMAADYAALHRCQEALQYYQEALACVEQTMGESYVLVLNNISECYLEDNQLDKAMDFALEAFKIAEKLPSNASLLNHCYYTFGIIYKEKHQMDQAMAHFLKALSFAEQEETRYHIIEVKVAIGKLYLEQNDYHTALTYLLSASEIATAINASEYLNEVALLVANACKAIKDSEKTINH